MAYFLGGLGAGVLITIGFIYFNIGRHKRIPSLTKYVVFSIMVLIAYVIAEMIVSTMSGVSHPDLSTLIGSTFGGEILFCCLIKIFKLKGENNNEQ
jgi:hypothetical protein